MKTVIDAPIKQSPAKTDFIGRSKAEDKGNGTLRFVDNRTETARKNKLQDIIENRQSDIERDIGKNRAVVQPQLPQHRKTSVITESILPLPETHNHELNTSASDQPVKQRLMSYDTYKEKTKVKGSRRKKSRIYELDKALKAFDPTAEVPKRIDAYRTIYLECEKYLRIADTQKPKRKKGVTELKAEVDKEVTALLEPTLKEAEGADIASFEDKWNKTKDAARVIDFYKNVLQKDAAAEDARLVALHQLLIGRDLAKLEAIGEDPDAPAVTREIVKEMMANRGDITFEESLPGATRVKGGAKPFKVKHSLEQPGGEAERIGSLAHEMTHVAVGKTFDNSMLLFSFARDASDKALRELIAQRHEKVADLNSALGRADLTEAQTALVKSKLKYASGGKVGHYVSTFLSAKKISKKEAEEINAKIERVGLDNTVIEYDSVVNQILIYMRLWKVRKNNLLYKKVRDYAQQAFDRREKMRTK